MSLLGKGALAMWWDIAPEVRAGFEDWHSHEHFRERLGIPGFLRGSRWGSASGGEGFFILYEVEAHETLSSPAYLAHLNAPTPWSTQMMPHHRNMVRSQCRVLESRGGGVARHALTVRLSPAPGREGELRGFIASRTGELINRPGVVGVHLLAHETPPIAKTTEQALRKGADRAADWVLVACGYDTAGLAQLEASDFAQQALTAHGAGPEQIRGMYLLSYSATAPDVR
jgi:hypothetical protein